MGSQSLTVYRLAPECGQDFHLDQGLDLVVACSGGTHMVAPEAYKPYVGGNSNRCETWCQSLRLQGLALGPGENPARTRGRADKP